MEAGWLKQGSVFLVKDVVATKKSSSGYK